MILFLLLCFYIACASGQGFEFKTGNERLNAQTYQTAAETFDAQDDRTEDILHGVFALNDHKKWETDPLHCITCLDFMNGLFERIGETRDEDLISETMHDYGYNYGPFWHVVQHVEPLLTSSIAFSKKTPLTAKIMCRRLERISTKICDFRKRFKYADI